MTAPTTPKADPLSPQWEDCKICGGDHWTKDHPDLRLPPEKQGPMPPDRRTPTTPEAALATALHDTFPAEYDGGVPDVCNRWPEHEAHAAAILAVLPKGWCGHDDIEIDLLRGALVTAKAKIERMRAALVSAWAWAHPYLTKGADDQCLVCGQTGSYGHKEPEIVVELHVHALAPQEASDATD